MGSVIINLTPIMLGSALFPLWLISNLILLMGENGTIRSAALISGGIFTRLLQGFIFGAVFASIPVIALSNKSSPVTYAIFMVTGIVFLSSALYIYFHGRDPDDPPPRWMTMVDKLSPRKLFLLGIAGVTIGIRPWIFTFAAMSIIREANLPLTESVTAYFVYVIGCMALLIIPLALDVLAPGKSKATFAKMRSWLERNSHLITMFVSAVFGAYFFARGFFGLLG